MFEYKKGIRSVGKRYEYLDYSKGFGILLIMFAHCIQYFEPMWGLNGYVCSFHVPIFFLVSGCLANYHSNRNINVKNFICKRTKALLIPYVIFSIFNSCLKLSVLLIKGDLTQKAFYSEMTALFITGNGTVWFLVTLFAIELLYLMVQILKLNKKFNGYIFYFIGLIMLILPYMFNEVSNPFGKVIVRIIAGFGYFVVGYLIVNFVDKLSSITAITISLILVLFGTISYILFGCTASFFDATFKNVLPSVLCSISISVSVIFGFYALEKIMLALYVKSFLRYCGQNSLIMMLVHPTILLFFTYPFGGFINKCIGIKGIIVSIILFVVIVVLEIPFIWIITNKIPWIIGRSKKD